ncbi:MAG TPA: hypothetical protein VFO86_01255, partial [Terriglobia bacterium]|nr:hypothetical protein [Terriglobia bacterium]
MTAFKNDATGEIVISPAGTTTENWWDWITGNAPAATASYFPEQLLQAAEFYLDVVKANPGTTTFSFTGHSLGGGLAAVMAVLFDKQAITFDEAPFVKSADSREIVNELRTSLIEHDYELPSELKNYITSLDPTGAILPSPSRVAREDNVRNIYVTGEVLSVAPTELFAVISASLGIAAESLQLAIAGIGVDKIAPSPEPLDPGADAMLGWGYDFGFGSFGDPVHLHSIALLTAFLQSESFLQTVQNHPELLPRIFAGIYSKF